GVPINIPKGFMNSFQKNKRQLEAENKQPKKTRGLGPIGKAVVVLGFVLSLTEVAFMATSGADLRASRVLYDVLPGLVLIALPFLSIIGGSPKRRLAGDAFVHALLRSEERRVGKECRSR